MKLQKLHNVLDRIRAKILLTKKFILLITLCSRIKNRSIFKWRKVCSSLLSVSGNFVAFDFVAFIISIRTTAGLCQ